MTTAMANLHERWGLSTSDIARALDIPTRAVRQARDNHAEGFIYEAADRLDAFLHQAHNYGVDEPAAWMSVPVVEGYTVTRWDLYAAGRDELLKANAEGEFSDEDMLAVFNPDWRRAYWTSFKTVEAADGGLSVVGKTYDDVRAQMPEVA